MTPTPNYDMIHEYIVQAISTDRLNEEGLPSGTETEKFAGLAQIFRAEYGWRCGQINHQQAFAEWLQGLPSAVHIAFADSDILALSVDWECLPKDHTGHQADRILQGYWNFMACNISKFARRAGVELF